ncbi:hypothetical protein SADUNF_Sadunf09G0074000 [Salix dunnii]|uniref:Uncharacterized protein n=1 Tax=Salix dunnii TaxID=1413687 RepID=A0A835MTA6_9ROSI|nr:hypothetical protein SADUNF_Sadunf09G0074000 [Salix dunnii]
MSEWVRKMVKQMGGEDGRRSKWVWGVDLYIKKLLRFFEDMKLMGFVPDKVTSNTLLDVYGKSRLIKEAIEIPPVPKCYSLMSNRASCSSDTLTSMNAPDAAASLAAN